jgi:hypothetical protein
LWNSFFHVVTVTSLVTVTSIQRGICNDFGNQFGFRSTLHYATQSYWNQKSGLPLTNHDQPGHLIEMISLFLTVNTLITATAYQVVVVIVIVSHSK